MKTHELFRRLTRPVCLLLVLLTLVGYAVPKAEAASKLYIYGEKNAFGAPGETISTHVEPSGTPPYTYQWYIKEPGESNFTKAMATSDTYYMDITPERSGTQLYCVVTDAKGNIGTSDTVTMALFAITQQPKNTCAPAGEELTLSCKAVGDGLKYQWYYYYDGARMEYKDGTGEVYTTTMYSFRNGYRVKCEITDAYGNKLTTDWATISALSFLQQPENDIAASGKEVTASVSVDGEGVTYQWYIKNPGQTKFSKSSVTGSTYFYDMSSAKSGRQAYCVVTDQYGNSIRSNTVTFSMLSISKQPKNVTVAPKNTASVTVKATGQGLKYQWYVKDPGQSSFTKSSIKKATYSFKMTTAKSGRQVYCVITDKWGNSIRTDTVTMKQEAYAKITTQPKSVSGAAGSELRTTVKASGDGLKYQWYIKNPGQTKFSKSSVKDATYFFTLTSAKSGRQAYCVITDKYGNSVKSKTVTLTGKVTLTGSIEDVTRSSYGEVSVKASATGYGLKYQWYLKNPGQTKFSKSSVKDATYSFTLTSANSGRQVYCVITDKHGNSVKTQTITIKYEKKSEPTKPSGGEDDVLDKEDCMWCRGTGKCRDCGGTGYVYTYKPGIRGPVRERCGCPFGDCRWCYGTGKA